MNSTLFISFIPISNHRGEYKIFATTSTMFFYSMFCWISCCPDYVFLQGILPCKNERALRALKIFPLFMNITNMLNQFIFPTQGCFTVRAYKLF